MHFDQLLARIGAHPGQAIYFATGGTKHSTTFAGLLNDIQDLHKQLAALDIPPRSRIGIMGDNSYAWLVWSIALVTADYIPVHLSEDHFKISANNLMQTYLLALLVSDRHESEPLTGVLKLQEYARIPLVTKPRTAAVQANPDILCLVFSSGTTGHMKGLVISKSGTETIIAQFVEAFAIAPTDHYFSFLPFSYFQQAALNYCALYHGVEISVVSPDVLTTELPARAPTYIIAPPVFHQTIYKSARLMEQALKQNVVSKILGGRIRFMITAMAPIPANIIQYFWDGGVALFETFAVTETGMATWNTPSAYRIGTVGREAESGTLSISEDGELLIKREKPVSLGYFNTSEDIVRETFLPDGSVATGDIVEKDADGFYRIVGRKKHAIITREGKKFHPEEVELLLKECIPNTTPIIYHEDETERVAALICGSSEQGDPPSDAICQQIQRINAELPSYKRILAAYRTDYTPTYENGFLTRNLKLNRKNIQLALKNKAVANLQQLL